MTMILLIFLATQPNYPVFRIDNTDYQEAKYSAMPISYLRVKIQQAKILYYILG